MKKISAAMLCIVLAVSLTGCGGYSSSYKAVGLVRSASSVSAFMSFISFDGTMVFRLKCGDESTLRYTADLESGSAAVYCDCGGGKTELFSLRGGDEADSRFGDIVSGTVYVIIETDGVCRSGNFDFSLE